MSVLLQMFSTLDLDERAATYRNTEVDDYYNRLVSNLNLRGYFDQAESMLEPTWPKGAPEANAKSPSEKFLHYVVPGKPRFESDQAKALYLQVSRAVEAKQNLRFAFRVLAEEHRKTIRESLRQASERPATAAKMAHDQA